MGSCLNGASGYTEWCWLQIDFDIPMLDHCIAGAQFIREHELRYVILLTARAPWRAFSSVVVLSHVEFCLNAKMHSRGTHFLELSFACMLFSDHCRCMEMLRRNESVYVHCKAGKGRSTTIVLCYLVMFRGMTYVMF